MKRPASIITTKLFLGDHVVRKCPRTHEFEPSVRRITSSVVKHITKKACATNTTLPTSPHAFLMSLLRAQGFDAKVQQSLKLGEGFFVEPTEQQMSSYGQDTINAIRSKDIDMLRKMIRNGRSLQCSNKFGESIIHMACRRSYSDVVSFLVNEADVSVRVHDDYGRTPVHDACWTCEPNFALMKVLLRESPELLLVKDKRGHAPLEYVRKEHWEQWVDFLSENQKLLVPRDRISVKLFSAGKN